MITDAATQAPVKLLLTIPEAVKALGVSRSVLYQLLDTGEVISIKIGRSRRVPVITLEDFVARRLAALQSEG
jgi:excisionase family DNA binding protein